MRPSRFPHLSWRQEGDQTARRSRAELRPLLAEPYKVQGRKEEPAASQMAHDMSERLRDAGCLGAEIQVPEKWLWDQEV